MYIVGSKEMDNSEGGFFLGLENNLYISLFSGEEPLTYCCVKLL